MGLWKSIEKGVKKVTKPIENTAKKLTGLSGHDLGMIALSPFTAGASLLGTSSAKNMLKKPDETIKNAMEGLANGGPLGALVGAVGGAGGFGNIIPNTKTENDIAEGEGTASSAIKEQYEYNLKLQQQNQEWQTQMSNTSHQREVADLEAAGLNPILSAGGNGASTGTPGGGSVGMPDKVAEKTAEMQNKIAKMSLWNELANSAVERAKGQAQIENETNKTNAEVNKLMKEAGYTQNQIEYYNKHGVFPGASISGGALGVNASIPVGYKIEGSESAKNTQNKWEKYKKNPLRI